MEGSDARFLFEPAPRRNVPDHAQIMKGEEESPIRQCHEQMLKLVAKSFYKELINYGVNEAEVLSVAGHLLDNVMQKSGAPGRQAEYYNQLFTIKDVRDEWAAARRLTVQEVSLHPMEAGVFPQLAAWLREPAVAESFHPRFPDSPEELPRYFQGPTREYFSIFHGGGLAGIIGAENLDQESSRLEMRKLVGDSQKRGKGIGKRATFLFLYYVFMVRQFRKVYLHSLDINIRNLNLNGRFGFELEGVFLEEARIQDQWRDVVRMALTRAVWQKLFS